MKSTMTFNQSPLPDFTHIVPTEMLDTLRSLLKQNQDELQTILESKESYSWKSLMSPLEVIEERLNHFWLPIVHLHKANDNEPLRKAYNECLPLINSFQLSLIQNKKLYQAIQSVKVSDEYATLSLTQKKVIDDKIKLSERTGVLLTPEQQKQFIALREELSQLYAKFDDNIKDEFATWHFHTDNLDDLAGLPEILLENAANKAKKQGKSGWTFTLADAIPFLTTVKNRKMREMMCKARYTCASDQRPHEGKHDNTKVIEKIMQIRKTIAVDLLGYKSYCEYALETTMAKTPKNIMTFMNDLIETMQPLSKLDLDMLKEEASKDDIKTFEYWDLFYYEEKLKTKLFHISEEETRPYFPLDHVLNGWFSILQDLFNIKIKKRENIDSYDKAVHLYDICDQNDKLRGSVYLDLCERPNKAQGGWNFVLRHGNGTTQCPVSVICCNFNPPGETTTYLTYDQVKTLFHEFGHCLQVMLAKVDCASLSDFNSIAWDAVELPSSLFENFAKYNETLQRISKHKDTGEQFTATMVEKLNEVSYFQRAFNEMFSYAKSMYDLRLHDEYDPSNQSQIQDLMTEVRKLTIPTPDYFRTQNIFTHLFAGEYDSAYASRYYSYTWAEVIAAAAWTRFEREGIFNKDVAADFKRTILEAGFAKEPLGLLNEFLKRPADQMITKDAYLRQFQYNNLNKPMPIKKLSTLFTTKDLDKKEEKTQEIPEGNQNLFTCRS